MATDTGIKGTAFQVLGARQSLVSKSAGKDAARSGSKSAGRPQSQPSPLYVLDSACSGGTANVRGDAANPADATSHALRANPVSTKRSGSIPASNNSFSSPFANSTSTAAVHKGHTGLTGSYMSGGKDVARTRPASAPLRSSLSGGLTSAFSALAGRDQGPRSGGSNLPALPTDSLSAISPTGAHTRDMLSMSPLHRAATMRDNALHGKQRAWSLSGHRPMSGGLRRSQSYTSSAMEAAHNTYVGWPAGACAGNHANALHAAYSGNLEDAVSPGATDRGLTRDELLHSMFQHLELQQHSLMGVAQRQVSQHAFAIVPGRPSGASLTTGVSQVMTMPSSTVMASSGLIATSSGKLGTNGKNRLSFGPLLTSAAASSNPGTVIASNTQGGTTGTTAAGTAGIAACDGSVMPAAVTPRTARSKATTAAAATGKASTAADAAAAAKQASSTTDIPSQVKPGDTRPGTPLLTPVCNNTAGSSSSSCSAGSGALVRGTGAMVSMVQPTGRSTITCMQPSATLNKAGAHAACKGSVGQAAAAATSASTTATESRTVQVGSMASNSTIAHVASYSTPEGTTAAGAVNTTTAPVHHLAGNSSNAAITGQVGAVEQWSVRSPLNRRKLDQQQIDQQAGANFSKGTASSTTTATEVVVSTQQGGNTRRPSNLTLDMSQIRGPFTDSPDAVQTHNKSSVVRNNRNPSNSTPAGDPATVGVAGSTAVSGVAVSPSKLRQGAHGAVTQAAKAAASPTKAAVLEATASPSAISKGLFTNVRAAAAAGHLSPVASRERSRSGGGTSPKPKPGNVGAINSLVAASLSSSTWPHHQALGAEELQVLLTAVPGATALPHRSCQVMHELLSGCSELSDACGLGLGALPVFLAAYSPHQRHTWD